MCTTIKIDYPGGNVIARNMDWDDVPYNLLYHPAGTTFAKDLYGNPLTNQYHMAGLCFYTHNPLKDGINEHGLMGTTNMFIQMRLYADEPKKGLINLTGLDLFNYILGNCKTVEDIKDLLPKLHVANRNAKGRKVISPHFHHYFVDAKGDSIIVEPKGEKLQALEDKYGVMTNSPALNRHEKALEKNLDHFNVSKDLPGGLDPISRFVRAYHLKANLYSAEDCNHALEYAYSMLESLSIPEGVTKTEYDHTYTRYVCAYDNQSRLITARSHASPQIFSILLDDLIKTNQRTLIPLPQELTLSPLTIPQGSI